MKLRLEIEGKNAGSIIYKGQDCIELAVAYLNSIEAEKVEVQFIKEDGTRADAEFEGESPVQSAIKFVLAAEKLNIEIQQHPAIQENIDKSRLLTLRERLEMFLRFEYPRVWFTSLDVKKQYDSIYGNIGLSTVSTYLARMSRENILVRRGNRNQREYRFKEDIMTLHSTQSGVVE